jgi:hypothetical protein
MRRSLLALAAMLGALALVGPIAVLASSEQSCAGATFCVVDPADAPDAQLDGVCASTNMGLCTLRAAIQEAERAGGGTVVLPPGLGVYRLTIDPGNEGPAGLPRMWSATGDLDISTSITVEGAGQTPDDVVIDGTGTQGRHRIFDVHDACSAGACPSTHGRGSLTLTNLTLQNGLGDSDPETGHEHGGAIHNHGEIWLDRVAVINSEAPAGWGGGGITNAGVATWRVHDPNAKPGEAQLLTVTVAKNTAGARGGGIENLGDLRMVNVTIAENTAPAGKGGGIFFGVGPANVTPSTTIAAGTLVAKNPGGDCALAGGTVTSSGGNLAKDVRPSCGFTQASDRSGDPGFDTSGFVGPLFYPLQATSRAVDTNNVWCGYLPVGFDIQGVSRPQDGNGNGAPRCDTGSYEREATAPLTCNGAAATIYVDAQGVIVGGPDNGRPYRGRLLGTSGSDVMVGTSGRDRIVARQGNDRLCAGEKDDLLEAGPGNDTMTGDAAADTFNGGTGKDIVTDFNLDERDTKTGVP